MSEGDRFLGMTLAEVKEQMASERRGDEMTMQPIPRSGDFSIGGNVWPGLSKLIEECGEVGQVCGKIIGNHGRLDHWDGTNLADRLQDEMGDVLAAIEFVMQANPILVRYIVEDRKAAKLKMFMEWHNAGKDLP